MVEESFLLNMFEAGNGDSFLIKCLGEYKTNILIDFGYINTYKNHMEKHLKDMSNNGEKLDLVVVTHYDKDHISGGLKFFNDNGHSTHPHIIKVSEVWHNSYRHLNIGNTDIKLTEAERKYISNHSTFSLNERFKGTNDASARQGSALAANLHKLGYNWNGSFKNQAAMYYENNMVTLNEEVEILVLSPTHKELNNLEKIWRKELRNKFPTIDLNKDRLFDDAVECITLMNKAPNITSEKDATASLRLEKLAKGLFPEDIDPVNGSSICCILKFREKKLLMLGDALPSTIESQIRRIYKSADFPIIFDGIKISHHGSINNTSDNLLEIMDSKNYFISTNGMGYGHPDIETIAKIIIRENIGFTRNIYFSHKFAQFDYFNNEEWKQKYNYELYYKESSKDMISIPL